MLCNKSMYRACDAAVRHTLIHATYTSSGAAQVGFSRALRAAVQQALRRAVLRLDDAEGAGSGAVDKPRPLLNVVQRGAGTVDFVEGVDGRRGAPLRRL